MLEQLLADARRDDNVVGLIVHGSRGRGLFVTEQSDLDVILVVRELRGDYGGGHGDPIDVAEVTSLTRLPDWMLPALLWAKPALDKTGEIAEQVRELTAVDPASAAEPLDGFVNMTYRSLKNARAGNTLAALLDAQESMLLSLRPLRFAALSARESAVSARAHERTAAHRAPARSVARPRLAGVIDSWEPDVDWLRGG